jgi:hypothetical protein
MMLPRREAELIKKSVRWRRMLEKGFHRRNRAGKRRLALCIVEGLVFLRLSQACKLEAADLHWGLHDSGTCVSALQTIFARAGLKYHSTLFDLPHLQDSPRLNSALKRVVRELFALRVAGLSPSILGKIYETDLSGHKRGVFFTPDFLSEYLVSGTLKPMLGKTNFPTLLDPACGAGAFPLSMFAQLLKARGAPVNLKVKQRLLLRCVHGVDIDALGVELTKLSLLLKLHEGNKVLAHAPMPDLSASIRCGNALVASGFPKLNPLNWARAFPAITRAGGFDAVIVNPPYINIGQLTRQHGSALKKYLARRFHCARGAYDLFAPFMEQSLKLVRRGGRLGMIVPNKFATARFAANCRRMILGQTRLESLADITPLCNTSPHGVYPYLLICEKTRAAAGHKIRMVEAHDRADLKPAAAATWVLQSVINSRVQKLQAGK